MTSKDFLDSNSIGLFVMLLRNDCPNCKISYVQIINLMNYKLTSL